jgi:hypothetical protein
MSKFWFVLVFAALGNLYMTAESVSRNHGESVTRAGSAGNGSVRHAPPTVRGITSQGDTLTPPWPTTP